MKLSGRIIEITETASTNEYLRQLHQTERLSEGVTVSAQFQTHGRGQMGNSWESEAGKNLLFSTILFPAKVEIAKQFVISQMVSVSMQEALEQYVKPVTLKWPNDLYYGKKKLAGILIENDICGKNIALSIVGIGVNVNQEVFTSGSPNPVSLKQILGREVDKKQLLRIYLERMSHNYALLNKKKSDEIGQKYHSSLFRKEGFHPFRDEHSLFAARIEKVAPTGYLHLVTENGEKRKYFFKEIEFV